MGELSPPLFVDLDPITGRATPISYESMRAAFYRNYTISEDIPEHIRKELHTAVDRFALAYGQANANNAQLYNPLTDDAFLGGMRAFELALRERLAVSSGPSLKQLIERAMQHGLLPNGEHQELFYRLLRETRNAATHGQGTRHVGGMFLGWMIGALIEIINHLYEPFAS